MRNPVGIALLAAALRQLVGLHPHSGMGKPPMFGDYEAQRHWLELTTHLPVGEWYRAGPDNDLQYWGLDYPPLTAYASYAFGKAAQGVGLGDFVALHSSRGFESPASKAFFRGSVLLLDVALFFSGAWRACAALYPSGSKAEERRRLGAFALSLALPCLVLIDYGHFQYNSASLGLALWALDCLLRDRDALACVFFSLSLNFKHMSLYLAPAVAFLLLRRCLWRPLRLAALAAATAATFAACWAPFCVWAAPDETCAQGLLHVLSRLFPVGRGLYEDKVANFWFASSVLVKWKELFARERLVAFALGATLLALAPCALAVFRRPPSPTRTVLALFNSAMAFFLFSYQVHEKSLLLAAVPAMLLAPQRPLLVCWFGALATFSMYPLLRRDELSQAYAAVMCVFAALSAAFCSDAGAGAAASRRERLFVGASLLGGLLLHGYTALREPPAHLPDLQAVLFALYSFGNLVVAWGYALWWAFAAAPRSPEGPGEGKKRK